MKELESIVINIPNKIFEINHTPIGENCSDLIIKFEDGVWSVTGTYNYHVNGGPLRNKFSNKISELD